MIKMSQAPISSYFSSSENGPPPMHFAAFYIFENVVACIMPTSS